MYLPYPAGACIHSFAYPNYCIFLIYLVCCTQLPTGQSSTPVCCIYLLMTQRMYLVFCMHVYYLSLLCLPLSIMPTCYWYGYLVAQSAMLIPVISCTPSALCACLYFKPSLFTQIIILTYLLWLPDREPVFYCMYACLLDYHASCVHTQFAMPTYSHIAAYA